MVDTSSSALIGSVAAVAATTLYFGAYARLCMGGRYAQQWLGGRRKLVALSSCWTVFCVRVWEAVFFPHSVRSRWQGTDRPAAAAVAGYAPRQTMDGVLLPWVQPAVDRRHVCHRCVQGVRGERPEWTHNHNGLPNAPVPTWARHCRGFPCKCDCPRNSRTGRTCSSGWARRCPAFSGRCCSVARYESVVVLRCYRSPLLCRWFHTPSLLICIVGVLSGRA